MPKKEILAPKDVFSAHFAHGVKTGNTIWVAGEIGYTLERKLAGPDARSQAWQTFDNIKKILAAGGATMNDIVSTRIYVTKVEDIKEVQEARKDFLTDYIPPGAILVVKSLAREDILVEIEATAVIDS